MPQIDAFIPVEEMWDWLTMSGNLFDGRWTDVQSYAEGGRVWREEGEKRNRYRDISLSQMAEERFTPPPLVRAVVTASMSLEMNDKK